MKRLPVFVFCMFSLYATTFASCYNDSATSKNNSNHNANPSVDKMKIKIKRVYEKPSEEDGMRILVDRLWPRGLTKQKAAIDLWLKDIAPSTELRKWFAHDPEKWIEFRKKYLQELKDNKEQISIIKEHLKKEAVTLVYGAKDEEHNEAHVLEELLNL